MNYNVLHFKPGSIQIGNENVFLILDPKYIIISIIVRSMYKVGIKIEKNVSYVVVSYVIRSFKTPCNCHDSALSLSSAQGGDVFPVYLDK